MVRRFMRSLRSLLRGIMPSTVFFTTSAMPFFVKAACQALAAFPVVNARLEGDEVVYPVFINEAAYYYQGQAMTLTVKKTYPL